MFDFRFLHFLHRTSFDNSKSSTSKTFITGIISNSRTTDLPSTRCHEIIKQSSARPRALICFFIHHFICHVNDFQFRFSFSTSNAMKSKGCYFFLQSHYVWFPNWFKIPLNFFPFSYWFLLCALIQNQIIYLSVSLPSMKMNESKHEKCLLAKSKGFSLPFHTIRI